MKYAVIADIHGNSDALRAVLADIERHSVEQILNLGDFLSGPLDARGTAETLMKASWPSIRGNHDRWLIEQDAAEMGPSDRCAYDQLKPEHLAWLAKVPSTLTLPDGIYMCHGTPQSDLQYWLERVDPNGVVRAATLAEIEAEAKGVESSLILCAHTHIPRIVRLPDGRVIVNPGSVGLPAYDDEAPVPHHMQTGTPQCVLCFGREGRWRLVGDLPIYSL